MLRNRPVEGMALVAQRQENASGAADAQQAQEETAQTIASRNATLFAPVPKEINTADRKKHLKYMQKLRSNITMVHVTM